MAETPPPAQMSVFPPSRWCLSPCCCHGLLSPSICNSLSASEGNDLGVNPHGFSASHGHAEHEHGELSVGMLAAGLHLWMEVHKKKPAGTTARTATAGRQETATLQLTLQWTCRRPLHCRVRWEATAGSRGLIAWLGGSPLMGSGTPGKGGLHMYCMRTHIPECIICDTSCNMYVPCACETRGAYVLDMVLCRRITTACTDCSRCCVCHIPGPFCIDPQLEVAYAQSNCSNYLVILP